jgi:hypothetical protein
MSEHYDPSDFNTAMNTGHGLSWVDFGGSPNPLPPHLVTFLPPGLAPIGFTTNGTPVYKAMVPPEPQSDAVQKLFPEGTKTHSPCACGKPHDPRPIPGKIPAPENAPGRLSGSFVGTDEALKAFGDVEGLKDAAAKVRAMPRLAPVDETEKLKPLSRMTAEERVKWERRKEEIMRAFEATFTPATPAVKTVVRPWVKVALAFLVFGLAVFVRVWLARRMGVAFLALLVAISLSACCDCPKKAAKIKRELDSVLVRTEPREDMTAAQRAKLLVDEDVLKGDIADLASGR